MCFKICADIGPSSPQILENLPDDVDSRSITLSNKPFGGEDRKLTSLKGVAIERVGLRCRHFFGGRKYSNVNDCCAGMATSCFSNM